MSAAAATKDFDEYVDYEGEEETTEEQKGAGAAAGSEVAKKGTYVGVHSASFKDFLLKPELLRAITDCGFEHPSEVQHECIQQATLGVDVLCQAKSGMGKTAVFVLATLQQIDPTDENVQCIVLCHARELAYQICFEYERLAKFLNGIKVKVLYGGVPIAQHRQMLETEHPNIIVGTPGRVLQLAREGNLKLAKVKHFILDECDKMLESVGMRADVQEIFKLTPHAKQVMMFTATLNDEIRRVCKKFMQKPMEVLVSSSKFLTLDGLQQHYLQLEENQKNRKLIELLEALDFNQVVVFVKSRSRAEALHALLAKNNVEVVFTHSKLPMQERIKRLHAFKVMEKRVMVTTDLFGRGIDVQNVNIVINYDMPIDGDEVMGSGVDAYLHRVGRAGRFGTKGLAISFVAGDEDVALLNAIQERFEVQITPLPESIDVSTYMNA